MNNSNETSIILMIIFLVGVGVGYSIDYLDRIKRLNQDRLIEECEKELPRNQSCKLVRAVPVTKPCFTPTIKGDTSTLHRTKCLEKPQ